MNALSDIISLMHEDDIKLFKSYLHQKNKLADVKNIRLYKFLKTDDIKQKNKL